MTRCIYNDHWHELETLTIPIQSQAVQYGTGLFETLRTYENKSLPFLERHLERLFNSISVLNLCCSFSREQVKEMVLRLVEEHEFELQRIKILVLPDGVLITSSELVEVACDSYRLTTWQGRRSMPEHKSTSYFDCHLAWQSAQAQGFDDSILVDQTGAIYETGRANLFWVNNDQVYTRKSGVLPGVMREFVLSLANPVTRFSGINLDELLAADEVFISNSIRGIVPVTTINERPFARHDITTHVQQQLDRFVALKA